MNSLDFREVELQRLRADSRRCRRCKPDHAADVELDRLVGTWVNHWSKLSE